MNPPIRYAEDRETLWRRLRDGTIDCIATDHAPHTLENKMLGFPQAHSGMPGVETSLPLMLTHAADGRCSVPDVVGWMCEGPARVYGMTGKGRLAEGMDADLVLVDMESHREVRDADTWTRVGWTALDRMALTGWPMLTIVDGVVVHSRDSGGSIAWKRCSCPRIHRTSSGVLLISPRQSQSPRLPFGPRWSPSSSSGSVASPSSS